MYRPVTGIQWVALCMLATAGACNGWEQCLLFILLFLTYRVGHKMTPFSYLSCFFFRCFICLFLVYSLIIC